MEKTTRINNPSTLNAASIANDLALGKEVILQFSQVPSDRLLSGINALCAAHTNQLTVRFYSAEGFNCKCLQHLANVKSLEVDCITRVSNIASLTELKHLSKLSLGVYELKETEILESDNFKHLIALSIGATKTKSLNLEHLKNLTQLKWLFIEGHTKNIQAISELSHLNYLRLHGITKTSLDFINPLKQLKTLELTLGGRENLDEIKENNIERLIIGRVRGLNQLNNLKDFSALKYLCISEQKQLEALTLEKSNSTLIALNIHDCKTLSAITGLAHLSALCFLRVWQTNLAFESLLANGLPSQLSHFTFGGQKAKESTLIASKLLTLGYQEATWFNLPLEVK